MNDTERKFFYNINSSSDIIEDALLSKIEQMSFVSIRAWQLYCNLLSRHLIFGRPSYTITDTKEYGGMLRYVASFNSAQPTVEQMKSFLSNPSLISDYTNADKEGKPWEVFESSAIDVKDVTSFNPQDFLESINGIDAEFYPILILSLIDTFNGIDMCRIGSGIPISFENICKSLMNSVSVFSSIGLSKSYSKYLTNDMRIIAAYDNIKNIIIFNDNRRTDDNALLEAASKAQSVSSSVDGEPLKVGRIVVKTIINLMNHGYSKEEAKDMLQEYIH